MYELAVFCKVRSFDDVTVLPLGAMPCVVAMWAFQSVGSVGFTLLAPSMVMSRHHAEELVAATHEPSVQFLEHWALACLMTCTMVAPAIWFLYDALTDRIDARGEMKTQLASFTTKDLLCSVEEDRELVESCIMRLFGSTGAFDEFVRTQLKRRFLSDQGTASALPYSTILVGSLPHIFALGDFALSNVHNGDACLHALCAGLALIFVADIVGMHLVGVIARRLHCRSPTRRRVRRWTGMLMATLAFTLINGTAMACWSPAMPVAVKLPAILVLSALTAWRYDVFPCLRGGRFAARSQSSAIAGAGAPGEEGGSRRRKDAADADGSEGSAQQLRGQAITSL